MMDSLNNSVIGSGIKSKLFFSLYLLIKQSSKNRLLLKCWEKKIKIKDSLKARSRHHCLIQILNL